MGKKGKKELTQQFCCPLSFANASLRRLAELYERRGKRRKGKERAKKSLLAKFSPKTLPLPHVACSTVYRYTDMFLWSFQDRLQAQDEKLAPTRSMSIYSKEARLLSNSSKTDHQCYWLSLRPYSHLLLSFWIWGMRTNLPDLPPSPGHALWGHYHFFKKWSEILSSLRILD